MLATLNLLSPQKKSALRAVFFLAFLRTLLLLICTISAFTFFTLLAVRTVLAITHDDLTSRSALVEAELGTVTTETREINGYIKRIEDYQRSFTRWSTFLVTLTGMIPAGVSTDEIRIEGNTVSLSGSAATRDDVLTLQSNLKESGLFSEVQSPLSNILQQRNVKFTFQLVLAEPQVAK